MATISICEAFDRLAELFKLLLDDRQPSLIPVFEGGSSRHSGSWV
jgi:hypothetical protein